MLNLAYAPDIPRSMIEVLEFHARRIGLPLSEVEALGQSLDLVEAFIVESEAGRGSVYADFVREHGAGAVAFASRSRGTVSSARARTGAS
ncbi:MAG: hypothetical protein ACYDDF_07960 [Thermoplasmatota archaeon]